jgi:hypothetical protein
LGEIPVAREEDTMRILVCQMGGCAGVEVREIKISATERLIQIYNKNLCLFMELNFNRSKVNSSTNLTSSFTREEREMRCVTAHNVTETDALFGKHQPVGTGMLCRHKFRSRPKGSRMGVFMVFFCYPMHITKIVVAYHPHTSKVE